jgi:hypothetical protein
LLQPQLLSVQWRYRKLIIHKVVVMSVIGSVDPAKFVPIFWGVEGYASRTPGRWDAYCKKRGLVAFAAAQEAHLVGFAVAESHPNVVHVLSLVGDTDTCRVLLNRLVMAAAERDMSVWCPIGQADVRQLLRRLGFVRETKGQFQGRPSYLYYWDRNEDVWA